MREGKFGDGDVGGTELMAEHVDMDPGDCTVAIRKFDTGATRDTDTNKPSYFGFESALVSKRFAEYMHKNRLQRDGSVRAADNWKRGIPDIAYVESLCRHVKDVELYYEGFPEAAKEGLETALCAVLFNARGLLYEILKRRKYHLEQPVIT